MSGTGEDVSVAAGGAGRPGYRYVVVAMLTLVYTFNFLDRQILSVLAEPIRKELHLSDTQLGLLTGLTFALFYTTFGIPLAWLADRTRRIWIVAGALSVWSLFSAACDLAGNFAQLALARIGVGVGEAGGSPPSHSLISDYFPPAQRGTALGLLSIGAPLGGALGVGVGGAIAAAHGWRAAFMVVGLSGLVLAALVLLIVREPLRGRMDPLGDGQTHEPSPPLGRGIAEFFADPVLRCTALGAGCSAFLAFGIGNWAPAFLIRVRHMEMGDLALYFGLVVGFAGVVGVAGSGWLVDRLRRYSPRAYALVPGAATLISLPFFIGFLMAPTWPLAVASFAVSTVLNGVYLAPAMTVVQNAVAPSRRSLSSALFMFIFNLIGMGGGPLFVGMISDRMHGSFGELSLQIGLAALTPVFLLTALAHYATSRAIGKQVGAGEGRLGRLDAQVQAAR
ncbi:MAG: MFS transporter [Phenylobacterium sp.]|uniref:spinster family MFS transporter n=1 Tax=Phenylobacterium sp. TaxID=1871053 RepID=UPI002732C5D7|nr:MFS transporter [Phenylobacterium sp.]MDP3173446.1 MFS transporter [Phenylobacterium sp.]